MSEAKELNSKRKRTRSAKGLALDEMKTLKSGKQSPKAKQSKSSDKAKSKASRKIVFNEPEKEQSSAQVNNNDSVMVISKNKRIVDSHKSKSGSLKPKTRNPCNEVGKEMIIDPCFKNMLRKELAAEKHAKERVINSTETNVLQESVERSDGICMEVEGLEELDYVDNIVDNELSDFEDGMLESAEVLLGVTKSMGNEEQCKGEACVN